MLYVRLEVHVPSITSREITDVLYGLTEHVLKMICQMLEIEIILTTGIWRFRWLFDNHTTTRLLTDNLHIGHMRNIYQLDGSAFFRTQSYITEICYFEFLLRLLV